MNAVGRRIALAIVCLAAGTAAAQLPPIELPELPRQPKPIAVSQEPEKPKAKDAPKEKNGKGKDGDDKNGENGKEEEKKPAWKAWQPTGRTMTVGECLAVGQERQPAIKAAVASLAASERGYLSLLGLRRAAEFFSPDLPVRRYQSQRGLSAACAEVVKVRQENTYDICRLYFTYVYATQQEQTAADIVEQLDEFYDIARRLLELPVPDPKVKVNEFTLGSFDAVIAEVRDLREKASTGRKKAYFALQEAMGVGPEFEFVPADKELPLLQGSVTQEQVVELALTRRPELVQAAALVDVTRLEVSAQELLARRQRASTFASGSDLHARFLPAPVRNGEYRPGAVPPEMPADIPGSAQDRVERVKQYLRRHEAAYDKAVGLVRLEAVNAFLNWQHAGRRVADSKAAHERAQKLVEKARTAAQAQLNPELLVQTESLASKAQARYVEAVHEQVLALIALEKVTAGGVVPAFPNR